MEIESRLYPISCRSKKKNMLKRKPAKRTLIGKEVCILERLPLEHCQRYYKTCRVKRDFNKEKYKIPMGFNKIDYAEEKD